MKIDQIEIKAETGVIQVRMKKILFDADGNEVEGGFHRDIVNPGEKDKLVSYLGQSKADALGEQVWTQEIINAYQDSSVQ